MGEESYALRVVLSGHFICITAKAVLEFEKNAHLTWQASSPHAIKRADALSIISQSSYTRGSFWMSHLDNTMVYIITDSNICVCQSSHHHFARLRSLCLS